MSPLSVPLKMQLLEAGTREEVANLQVTALNARMTAQTAIAHMTAQRSVVLEHCMSTDANILVMPHAATRAAWAVGTQPSLMVCVTLPAGQLGMALECETGQHHACRANARAHVDAYCCCEWYGRSKQDKQAQNKQRQDNWQAKGQHQPVWASISHRLTAFDCYSHPPAGCCLITSLCNSLITTSSFCSDLGRCTDLCTMIFLEP